MSVHDSQIRFVGLVPGLIGAIAVPAHAVEIIVRNDAMTDAASVSPCQCFVPGDLAAAWLTAPVDGRIVAVQVFWESPTGGAGDSTEMAIHIFDGSTFPTPGSVLENESTDDAVVTAPVLSDGVLNEYRFLDQAQTIPMSVPVSAGQTFAVGLEILNQSSGNSFAPSLAYDDGCQAGLNGVFIFDLGTWSDACDEGVPGDWVIRAVIESDTDIPAVSTWGALVLGLMLLTAGAVASRRRRARTCA